MECNEEYAKVWKQQLTFFDKHFPLLSLLWNTFSSLVFSCYDDHSFGLVCSYLEDHHYHSNSFVRRCWYHELLLLLFLTPDGQIQIFTAEMKLHSRLFKSSKSQQWTQDMIVVCLFFCRNWRLLWSNDPPSISYIIGVSPTSNPYLFLFFFGVGERIEESFLP
jgi:hypothetical protein